MEAEGGAGSPVFYHRLPYNQSRGPSCSCDCTLGSTGSEVVCARCSLHPSVAQRGELMREAEVPATTVGSVAQADVTVEEPPQSPFPEPPPSPPAAEEYGVPVPHSGLLQVTERRQPLSSVSSLEVHFDLLDLTELTDMSDQELAEVFADSDDENVPNDPFPGLHHPALPRGGYMRSPSWSRMKADHGREMKRHSESEAQPGLVDTLLTVEKLKED